MPRDLQLPGGLTPEEERAVLLALERHFLAERPRPKAWTIAGRLEAMRVGAIQARRSIESSWRWGSHLPFARTGAPSLHGRSDAR